MSTRQGESLLALQAVPVSVGLRLEPRAVFDHLHQMAQRQAPPSISETKNVAVNLITEKDNSGIFARNLNQQASI